MREYVANGKSALRNAAKQVELLRAHDALLKAEKRKLRQRRKYLGIKVEYWQALKAGDEARAEALAIEAADVARTLH